MSAPPVQKMREASAPAVSRSGSSARHTADADRMQLLDSVRLIAAIGVIVSHVTSELYPHSPLWAVGSFSVPFYLFAALYFTVRGFTKDPKREAGPYLLGRVVKLYLPFLLWNFAYELMHKLKYPSSPMTPPVTLLWAATYAHLYFLPLLGITTLVVVLLMKPIRQSFAFRVAFTVVLVVLSICSVVWWRPADISDYPTVIEQTLYHTLRTLAPALLAIVFAMWAGTHVRPFRVSPKTGLLGVALMLSTLTWQIVYARHPILRTLSGFGLVLIAFTPFYLPALKPVAMVGRHSFGIYLSHVAFIRIGINVAGHFGIHGGPWLAIGVGVFSLLCGAILSMVLAQSRWTSWMVGCDVAPEKRAKPFNSVPSSLPQTARPQMPESLPNVPH